MNILNIHFTMFMQAWLVDAQPLADIQQLRY